MIPVDVPNFVPFTGQKVTGRVAKIYDGDTVTVVLPMADSYYKFRVRIDGIDTPEMKVLEQKESAIKARNYLAMLITGHETPDLTEYEYLIDLECRGTDKYGRLLAKALVSGVDLGQKMIDAGHANPYDGGTKLSFFPE